MDIDNIPIHQFYWNAELYAKVILAAAGDSEVTLKHGQSGKSCQCLRYFTVHGSVPGGAHARLKWLARENPGQLLRLLERAQHRFPPSSFIVYCDSQSGATVQWYQVRSVLSDLQKSVRKYSAARVIHALADLEGVTVESSNGREKIISSATELAGGGAYDHLMKMIDEDPNHLQSVLKSVEPLLKRGSTWRDGAVTDRDVLDVFRDLKEVLRRKKNVAATTILALNAESGIIIRSLGEGEKLLTGEVAEGGAYAYLIKMAGEDPTHLQSLVENVQRVIQGAKEDLIWRDEFSPSAATVTGLMVRHVCHSLKLLVRKNRAARLILAEAEEIPAQQGGKVRQKLRKAVLSGERQYYAKLKSLAQNPKRLQQLLEAAQSLVLYSDPDKELDSKGDSQHSCIQTQLTVGDLAKVCEELYSIRDKWRDLALQLGVPVEKLDYIQATHPDSADCLRETVSDWLTNSPAPTWQVLTTALENRTVNEYGLAQTLKEEYCKAEVVRLAMKDLSTVHEELYDARFKWYNLGLKLGVEVAVLDKIKQEFNNASDCLREVLQHWLQSSPCPTWEEACAALRSCTVGGHRLAQQLEGTYGPVAESGAEDGASSESGSRDSELRETLEAIMTELQTLADSSHQQGGREEEPCTSQGKDGSCAPSGGSSGGSGSLPSSGDDSSDQECSPPPVNWELEARLLALKEGLAKMQQQEPTRQQLAGDYNRRHESRHLRIPSGSPGPSSGCSSTCLSSSDDFSDSSVGSDQEWSPSQGGERRHSGRKRSAGGHVTTRETPPAKHLKMDADTHNSVQLQYRASSCQVPKYDRLLTRFPQLIESLAYTTRAEDLADKLLREKLITKGCWEEACLPTVANSMRTRRLIGAVLSQVELNASNYDKFVSVLGEFNGLQDIVQLVEGV